MESSQDGELFRQFMEWKNSRDIDPDLAASGNSGSSEESGGGMESETQASDLDEQQKMPGDSEPQDVAASSGAGSGDTLALPSADEYLAVGGKGKKSTKARKDFLVSLYAYFLGSMHFNLLFVFVMHKQHILRIASQEAKVWGSRISWGKVTPAQRKYIHERVSLVLFIHGTIYLLCVA